MNRKATTTPAQTEDAVLQLEHDMVEIVRADVADEAEFRRLAFVSHQDQVERIVSIRILDLAQCPDGITAIGHAQLEIGGLVFLVRSADLDRDEGVVHEHLQPAIGHVDRDEFIAFCPPDAAHLLKQVGSDTLDARGLRVPLLRLACRCRQTEA